MTQDDHLVLILDDDRSMLGGLDRLLKSHGYTVKLHSDPNGLFNAGPPRVPSCLLLDNQLGNGITGIQVHAELNRRGWFLPTVFLTAHWNVKSIVSAMRAGADGFLTKPFDPAELLEAVSQALERARADHQNGRAHADLRAKAETLTEREREIVRLVVAGMLNKEIADQLNLALITVKVHRGRAMRKLGAGNPAELAKLATLAGIGN